MIPRAIFLTALIGGMIFIFANALLPAAVLPGYLCFKIWMRHSLKSCCMLRVKRSRLARLLISPPLPYWRPVDGDAGVARLMYVMGRDGVFPKASSVMYTRNGVLRR